MSRIHPPEGLLSEHDAHLCDIFGREARLHFSDASWSEVSQRISLQWEALRRCDEPSWAKARALVQQAFERAGTELRGE